MRRDRLAVGIVHVLSTAGLAAGLTTALAAGLAGCGTSPLDMNREQSLRTYVTEAARSELAEASARPQSRMTTRDSDPLPIDPKFLPELEAMAGPASREMTARDYGADLTGAESQSVGVTLRHAIRAAAHAPGGGRDACASP